MARAVMNLTKALLTSAPDPAQIERRLEFPTVKHAVLAADSAEWLSTHEKDGSVLRSILHTEYANQPGVFCHGKERKI
jgi:hypothetical protein